MQNPKKELQEYRDTLYKHDLILITARLNLLEQFHDPKHSLLWEGPHAFTISFFYQSIFDNLIITLSWLFSDSTTEKRSIVWYLNKVNEHNILSYDVIKANLQDIINEKDRIDKVKVVRDRWLAHRDPAPFNNPEAFFRENDISLDDLQALVNLAKRILREHFHLIDQMGISYDHPSADIKILSHHVVIGLDFRN